MDSLRPPLYDYNRIPISLSAYRRGVNDCLINDVSISSRVNPSVTSFSFPICGMSSSTSIPPRGSRSFYRLFFLTSVFFGVSFSLLCSSRALRFLHYTAHKPLMQPLDKRPLHQIQSQANFLTTHLAVPACNVSPLTRPSSSTPGHTTLFPSASA